MGIQLFPTANYAISAIQPIGMGEQGCLWQVHPNQQASGKLGTIVLRKPVFYGIVRRHRTFNGNGTAIAVPMSLT